MVNIGVQNPLQLDWKVPCKPTFRRDISLSSQGKIEAFLQVVSLMHSTQMFSHNSLYVVGKLILSHKNISLSMVTVCYVVIYAHVGSSLKSS